MSLDNPTSTHSASDPVPGMAVTPNPAEERTGPIRPCPECLRSTVVETVPAQSHTLSLHNTIHIPAYECCTYCGFVRGYIEETA